MKENNQSPSKSWKKEGICSFIAVLFQSLTISVVLPLGYLSLYFSKKDGADTLFDMMQTIVTLPIFGLSLYGDIIKSSEKIFGVRISLLIGQSMVILKLVLVYLQTVIETDSFSFFLAGFSYASGFFCSFGFALSNSILKRNFYMYFPNAGRTFPVIFSSFVSFGAAAFITVGELIINKNHVKPNPSDISDPDYFKSHLYPEEVFEKVKIFILFQIYITLFFSILAFAIVVPFKNPTESTPERPINRVSEGRNEQVILNMKGLVNFVVPKLKRNICSLAFCSCEVTLFKVLSFSMNFGLGMLLINYRIIGMINNIDEKYLQVTGTLVFGSIFIFIPVWSLINACIGFKYSMTIMNGLAVGVAVAIYFALKDNVLYTITVISASALLSGSSLLEPYIIEAIEEEYIGELINIIRIFSFFSYLLAETIGGAVVLSSKNFSLFLSITVGTSSMIAYIASTMENNICCKQQPQDESQERHQEEML